MPLPIDNLTTLHLDAGTDDPSQARVELLAAINKLKEVIAVLDDGAGSGLNADMVDGLHSSAFLPASSYTAADVLAKMLTVDGAGSGLDADLLDGINSTSFARVDAASNFTAAPTIAGNGIRHNGNIFHGRVNSDGSVNRLPAGWTVTKSGIPQYLITHNLNTTSYTIIAASNVAPGNYIAQPNGVNGSVVSVMSDAGGYISGTFGFMLILD